MSAAIEMTNVSKRYGATEALIAVTLDVQRGEMFGLIGSMARARPPRFA